MKIKTNVIQVKSVIAVSLLTAVAACSMSVPVSGQLSDGSETFIGSGEAGMNTAAPFTMTSSTGTDCAGTFDMKSLSSGSGEFMCDDGRSGSFNWTSNGSKISGSGTISGKPMTITMG